MQIGVMKYYTKAQQSKEDPDQKITELVPTVGFNVFVTKFHKCVFCFQNWIHNRHQFLTHFFFRKCYMFAAHCGRKITIIIHIIVSQ